MGDKPDPLTVFQKGVAISVWQNSGDEHSQWARFANDRVPFKRFGIKRCSGPSIGKSCDYWDRYKEDIALTAKLGCNAFRLSIEWARIEPQQGVIDQEAVQRYNDMLDCMEEYGIEPNATLHHFVHPEWFQELGAFEKEENIPIFVRWCVTAYKLFGHRIKFWATFNEPTCTMFLGWILGVHAPGKVMRVALAGKVLLNMLKAHGEAYRAIKALPGGDTAFVGMVHHHITFEPCGQGIFNFHSKWVAKWLEYWWGWSVVEEYFLTGVFKWKVPGLGQWIYWKDPQGRPPCDWWGINYYTRAVISWYLQPGRMPGEVMMDMFYPMYPEGLYKAIKRCSQLGIPMYITETGAPDARDDRRHLFIDSYYKAMLRAIREGYDVRGIYYWSLMDNFEWNMGFTMKFGLYSWDPVDRSKDRVLREGSRVLVQYYKTMPEELGAFREAAAKLLDSDANGIATTSSEDLAEEEESRIHGLESAEEIRQPKADINRPLLVPMRR